MSNRRRRANDFTDSLISFHQTTETENQSTYEISSKDSLESESERNKSNKCDSTKEGKSLESVILAGHVAPQYVSSSNSEQICEKTKDTFSVFDNTTSYLSIDCGLNKCINLFDNKYLNKKYDNTEDDTISHSVSLETGSSHNTNNNNNNNNNNSKKHKTIEIQCNLSDRRHSMSSSSLNNIILPNVQVRKSKSCVMFNNDSKCDSDCNNKVDQSPSAETGEDGTSHKKMETVASSVDASLLSKSSSPQNKNKYSLEKEEKEKQVSSISERSSTEGLNPSELKAFLYSLEDSKPPQETDILRRLSVHFCQDSPRHFTERLLTIVEESTNLDPEDYLNVSFCKLSEELRKICRLIEDETAPEWPQSPSVLVISKKKNQECTPVRPRKSLSTIATSNTGSITPNVKSPKKTYRYTAKSAKSPLHDSTTTFESLEAFCKKLYPDEHKTFRLNKTGQSDSPMKTLSTIMHTCESQMASLEDSPNVYEKLKQAAAETSRSRDKRDTKHGQRNVSVSQENHLGKTPDTPRKRTRVNGDGGERREIIETDELKDTIMYEIARKRQSYLNTARVMETDVGSAATQKTCPKIVVTAESNSTGCDPNFMKILKSVKDYQAYLDQHKPLLNILRQGSACGSSLHEKNDVSSKMITADDLRTAAASALSSNKENIQTTLRVPRTPTTRKPSASPSSSAKRHKVIAAKSKLFVTPTKPNVKSCRPRSTRTYFPHLGVACDVNKKKRDISPNQKSLYGVIENYDHVVSPIGTYIRGTDPHLVKNLRPKTDEMLLTPRKRQTMQQSPNHKSEMKFRLSPKQPQSEQVRTLEMLNINLDSHPKVHYKLPSHVRTIEEVDNRKIGNRVNELLRSTQDKVVIRHKGRTKSIQTNSLEEPEIHYDSAEESVHIEQTARKTQSSRIKN